MKYIAHSSNEHTGVEKVEDDHERASREREDQLAYQKERAMIRQVKGQLFKDQAELDQIKAEETRLLAVKA